MFKKKSNRHWSRDAVVYQIYPLSFKDSNRDGKGDLAGIVEKADYLNSGAHSLGVTAVWICPFYKSPMMDFGYDVEDFTAIDPSFGTMEDFDRLVTEFHNRGIKVIIDFVGNHTSDQHAWFIESKSSRNNPKRDWYVWHESDPQGGPPNNWVSVFSGSAWEFEPNTKQYYLHSFLKEQPDLNWRNPEVQAAMMKVIDFWVKKGVDGIRIDAFLHFLEDKLLREDPINPLYRSEQNDPYNALVHTHSVGEFEQTGIMTNFIKGVLDKHKDLLIIGEAYLGPKDIHKLHKAINSERFTIFNFSMINHKKPKAVDYKTLIDEYMLGAPTAFLPNFTFGNHDVDRLASRVGEALARTVAFLQFSLPGVPFVYYGEEIGMTNTKIPKEAIKDVIAKIFAGYHGGRDPERTPMQWDDSPYAGFSEKKPWLPVNDNYKTLNVYHADHDPESILYLYKKLIALRRETDALRLGTYVPLNSSSSNVFSFEIRHEAERYFVAANFDENVTRELLPIGAKSPQVVFSTTNRQSKHTMPDAIELLPFEGYIVKLQ